MLDNKNIQIAMTELSDQNRAVLDYYFSSAGKNLFTVVSEDKADAFITDYDYPGANDHLAKIQSTYNKPVVILSIREQELPSTVWLAKPITGHALADTASQLLHMMAENVADEAAVAEVLVAEKLATETHAAETLAAEKLAAETLATEALDAEILAAETLDAEILVAETLTVKAHHTDETISFDAVTVTDIEMPVLEEESNSNENDDIFDILVEKEEQLDENKKIEARLAMIGTAALVSATVSANENSNDDIDSQIAKKTELNRGSHLEFTDILLNSDIDTNIETGLNVETESEGEVDALLEALILGEGSKAEKASSDVNTEGDIFLESLALNSVLDANTYVENQIKEPIESEEIELEVSKIEDISLENRSLENSSPVNNELNDIDLSVEDFVVEEDSRKLIEENESVSLDEDFTIHDDLNPSKEDIYANTLKVDFANIKLGDTDTLTNTDEATETIDQSNPQENDLAIDIEEPLDTELFDIDSSKDVDTTLTETTDSGIEEIPLTLLDDVVTDDSASDDNFSNDIANFVTDNFTKDNSAPENVDLENLAPKNLDLNNFDTDLDSDDGSDLGDLLEEVFDETDDFVDDEVIVTEVSSFIAETQLIEEDFDSNDAATSVDKEEDNADFDLQSLLNEVREEAGGDAKFNTDGFGEGDSNASTFEETNAEKRWLQLCGNNESITAQKGVAKLSFTLKNHMLGVLLEKIESIKNSEQLYRLKYDDLIIVLDYTKDSIYCNLPITNDEYSDICFSQIEHKKIKIHDLDYSEVRLYRKKIEENPDRAHTFESFIWSTSLLTSRGRLPDSTEVTKKVGLKVWPNLTRVELLPHTMHIAAVFSKNPGNLLEVSKWLNIEQRYVFAFYNAALSLGMLELDSSKMKTPSISFGQNKSNDKSEERSFFSRLLKRLKS